MFFNDTKIRVRLEAQGTHYTYNPYSAYVSPGFSFLLNKKSDVAGNIDTVTSFVVAPNVKETYFVSVSRSPLTLCQYLLIISLLTRHFKKCICC